MTGRPKVIVVGAGAFGVSAALELRARGAVVELIDPGPLPHPDAASTDISKAVRIDYGADELYTELAQQSIIGQRGVRRQHQDRSSASKDEIRAGEIFVGHDHPFVPKVISPLVGVK